MRLFFLAITDRMDETLDMLRRKAEATAAQAYTPYSGQSAAAVLLLADGAWTPGVRVESASFSLVIPALVNAFTTAVAAGRMDIVAIALSRPFRAEDIAYLQSASSGSFRQAADDVFIADGSEALPALGDRLDPFLDGPVPETPETGMALARAAARRAHVPESAFPVGCVLVTADGRLVPGVNVEHSDWSRILCAERNALGTALSWGLAPAQAVYVTCLKDPTGSPCGACRQLLSELAPDATVWMDRGEAPPEAASPEGLLPGAFNGQTLTRSG